tara:strand:- start:1192 stop:1635 length:444 start_codon:yes stop_codon:yes gene_type:complete
MSKERLNNHTEFLGQPVKLTKRISRFFDLAKNTAFNSDYGKLRHGAVLVKGGSVINTCFNKDKFCSFGTKFRKPHRGPATIHAELGCVLGLPRSVTTGADMFVCRINNKGAFRYSKPCAMCHEVMAHVGIKRVYYTTNEGTVEMYKL